METATNHGGEETDVLIMCLFLLVSKSCALSFFRYSPGRPHIHSFGRFFLPASYARGEVGYSRSILPYFEEYISSTHHHYTDCLLCLLTTSPPLPVAVAGEERRTSLCLSLARGKGKQSTGKNRTTTAGYIQDNSPGYSEERACFKLGYREGEGV